MEVELDSDSQANSLGITAAPSDDVEGVAGDLSGRARGVAFARRILPGRGNWLPVVFLVAWLPLLAYLALLPRTPRVPVIPESLASSLAHVATSALLTALLYWIFAARAVDQRGRVRVAIVSAGLASGSGFALELVQSWYSNVRLFEGSDIVSNILGAGLAAIILATLADLGVSRRILSVGTVAGVIALTGGVLASLVIWNPAYPYRGDHWHVQYLVVVCGEWLPPFAGFQGGVHSHGDRLIHMHPLTAEEEGANATLGLFFQRAGGSLGETTLVLPSGETFSNGDACPNGEEGQLRVSDFKPSTFQRLSRIEDPGHYVPSNYQDILIEFGTVDDLN